MTVQGISGTAMMYLSPASAIERIRSSESAVLRAIEETRSSSTPSADTASVRFANLDYAHSRLRESGYSLQTGQAHQTAAQTAYRALSDIKSELTEIEGLIGKISEGDFSASQLADAQIIIESRLARINDIASSARYGGEGLFTGETVRVTTDSITGEGFEVWYDEVNTESLGLDTVDLVNLDIDTNAGIISDALTAVENIETDVTAGMAEIETVLGERVGDLHAAFESLMGAEKLNAPEETRWLSAGPGKSGIAGNLGTLLSPEDLAGVLSSLKLSPDVVSSLLG